MRAVNLIPREDRPGGIGRSGGAAYALIGTLALLVVAVTAYVLSANAVRQRTADVARTNARTAEVEREATLLKPYRDFAALKDARLATVSSLVLSRFDWEGAMRDLGRVIPSDVALTSFTGDVTGTASATSVSATPSTTATTTSTSSTAGSVPSIVIRGCTTHGHVAVARLLVDLRLVRGVTRVSLASSAKGVGASASSTGAATTSSTTTSSGSSQSCTGAGTAEFSITVFFKALPVAPAATGPGQTSVASTSTTAPGAASTTSGAGAPGASSPAPGSTPGASR